MNKMTGIPGDEVDKRYIFSRLQFSIDNTSVMIGDLIHVEAIFEKIGFPQLRSNRE